MLRYYPPAAQKKLGSPWVGPQQVVRKATGHTVGIQKDPEAPIIFIHVDDLKVCPPPGRPAWTPEPSKARLLCASTVAFRPGSHITDSDSSPSVDVSTWNNSNTPSSSDIHLKLDQPIDLTGHILSPFCARELNYQDCRFHSIAHLMCHRYAVLHGLKTFATETLAQKAGQELHNDYVITPSPEFGSLRKFFRTAVRELVHAYIDYPHPRAKGHGTSSGCNQIRQEIADTSGGMGRTSPVDRAEGIPVMSMPPPLTFTSSISPLPVVQTPVRSLTPNNRSLSFLQTGPGEDVQVHIPQHRGAVASISIASTDLLLHVEPLPMDQLILHDTQTVCGWPNSARSELSRSLAVTLQWLDGI